ncbi:MAG: cytochrome c family protein [Rhodobacteraceae bacterium]|nr:cytochrome c family protein [Paracoccaceae bacterium]
MLDTMTLTKAVAALCGALLVFLLGKWAAEEIYHMGGHGEASYVIEIDDPEDTDMGSQAEVNFDELMAAADVAKGAKVFKKCGACHKLEAGKNSTGPSLYGVVGRSIGTADGFGYSAAMSGLGGEWTPERMSEFLTKPSAYASGTSMGFTGLKKTSDRVNVIAYLDSLDN